MRGRFGLWVAAASVVAFTGAAQAADLGGYGGGPLRPGPTLYPPAPDDYGLRPAYPPSPVEPGRPPRRFTTSPDYAGTDYGLGKPSFYGMAPRPDWGRSSVD